MFYLPSAWPAPGLRQRDALMLRVLAHHAGRSFEGVRTDITWAPVFPHDDTGLLEAAP